MIDVSGAIGQAFGTQLGMMLTEGESQFEQFAVGTALGTVTRNLAEFITDAGFHTFSGPQFDFGTSLDVATRQFTDIPLDFATAAGGTVASFLLAELGEELGLDGFGSDLFNVVGGTYAGSVLNQVLENAFANEALLNGFDFAKGLAAFPGAVGSFFGSTLAQEILPAETLEGTIGGSLGSIAGSAGGAALLGTAFGESLGLLGNFLLPGIGAFFGTLIGTFIGDLFGDEPPDPEADIDVFLREGLSADRGGLLQVVAQWTAEDGFPAEPTIAWAKAVHEMSLEYARNVGGFDYANAWIDGLNYNDELIAAGFDPNEYARVLQQMHISIDGDGDYRFYVNDERVDNAEQMVDGAIAGFIKDAQVIGGDLLLKRAAANSTAVTTSALSGDMAVSEQYGNYLNDRDVINALIVADDQSVFSAGWAITLAQANDLELSKVNVSDFHGGLGGFFASLAYAGVNAAPGDVTLGRTSNGKVTIDVKLEDGAVVPGVVDVFANNVEVLEDGDGTVLRFTFNNSMADAGYHNVTGTQAGGGGLVEVTGETEGRDIWFAASNAGHVVVDRGVRVIGLNEDEVISSDDILVGAGGNDQIDGAAGWDWIDGRNGNDLLRGGGEADVLIGGAGNDTLRGGYDLDYLEGGAGADKLIGGDDYEPVPVLDTDWDTAAYVTSNAAVTVNLTTKAASGGHATGDTFFYITNLIGSAFADRLTGDANRNVLEGGAGADTLNGGTNGSSEIIDFASYFHAGGGVTASLADRTINTGDAEGDVYQNILGLEGSAFADVLYGDSGSNALYGQGGDDILVVGAGSDFAFGSFGFDVMSYREHGAAITLNLENWASSSAVVKDDSAVGVEAFEGTAFNDTLTGRQTRDGTSGLPQHDVLLGLGGHDLIKGQAGDDYLYGGDGADSLYGGEGDDVLDFGAGAAGLNQFAFGEAGDDAYRYSKALGSSFINASAEGADGGDDKIVFTEFLLSNLGVVSSGNFLRFRWSEASETGLLYVAELGARIERFEFADGSAVSSIVVGAGGLQLGGGAGADLINAGSGDDTIEGGDGADTLSAGAGVDVIWGRNGNDKLYGGDGADKLYGGDGDDTLDFGLDTVGGNQFAFGQAGNDTYVYSRSIGNSYIYSNAEVAGGGQDTLIFNEFSLDQLLVLNSGDLLRFKWTDGADTGSIYLGELGAQIERYEFAGGVTLSSISVAAGGGLQVIGTNSGDLINASASADTIDGGSGADTMAGGLGDDRYIVDSVGDKVEETSGGGVDTVAASVSFSLGGANLEHMRLTGGANIDATGNSLDNNIFGNNGSNIIDGKTGSDRLTGSGGADTFVFSTAAGSGNIDTVVDFAPDQDKIWLASNAFTGLSAGALTAHEFRFGATALDASDRILYDDATGALFWDRDGIGTAYDAIQFAKLSSGLRAAGFDQHDFLVT